MSDTKNTLRIGGFPGLYVQGQGALLNLASIIRDLGGAQPFIVSDDIVQAAIGVRLAERLASDGLTARRLRFKGECTQADIDALSSEARRGGADVIVGLGGGKCIDTAKGVSKAVGARLIIAPTIASNDSPTSRLIVLYDDMHKVTGTDLLKRNPDAVVVDTSEIVKAPVRYFRAGIGDALSKTFEAAQCQRTHALNFFRGLPTNTAGILADQCYDIIYRHGEAAVADVTAHICSAAVETVTEAVVLQSGVGFETGGLSISHALIRGLTAVPALSNALHGEMVAFGTLVQLILEKRNPGELDQHIELVRRLKLGATWRALGKPELSAEDLDAIAWITAKAPYAANFAPPTDAAAIRDALIEADNLGRRAGL